MANATGSKTLSKREQTLIAAAADACACLNFRKASRVVTQLYDEALAPSGLRSTQVVILMAAAILEKPGIMDLAENLVLDRTTLTRTLKPLQEQGLLELKTGSDRRKKEVHLTGSGRAALRKAVPLWEKCQNTFVAQIGPGRWRDLHKGLQETVRRTQEVVGTTVS